MRPDRHWSRAAHVGQRAGQVPAPQLVFGAVGVRRRGVAVTGSAIGTACADVRMAAASGIYTLACGMHDVVDPPQGGNRPQLPFRR